MSINQTHANAVLRRQFNDRMKRVKEADKAAIETLEELFPLNSWGHKWGRLGIQSYRVKGHYIGKHARPWVIGVRDDREAPELLSPTFLMNEHEFAVTREAHAGKVT